MRLGDTILVRMHGAYNGTDIAPAIITRIWNHGEAGTVVNCTAFPDNHSAVSLTSVLVSPSKPDDPELGTGWVRPPEPSPVEPGENVGPNVTNLPQAEVASKRKTAK